MYPNYDGDWYSDPYGQEDYFPSSPYQPMNYYEPYPDERIFAPGPPFGGPSSGSSPGMPGSQPQMGMPGSQPQMGMPGSQPQMGMPGSQPQMGMPGSQPQMGMPGQGQSGPPTSPPPSYVPAQTQALHAGTFAVDPGSMRRCLFRYTYIWMRNRQQFWFYPIFLGRNSVAGWRWTGFRWMYFGLSLRDIESFTCV